MVTVEEKLKLFSKILFDKVGKKNKSKLDECESLQKSIIDEKTGEFKKQADIMLEKCLNECDKEKVLIVSKAKMNEKKLILKTKNNLLNELLSALTDKMQSFVDTDEYKSLLFDELNKTSTALKDSSNIIIELTGKDIKRFEKTVRSTFKNKNVDLKENNYLIGGFCAIDEKNDIKVDFSLESKIDLSKEYAGEQLFNLLQ
jgi:V/A-type H+-transporting ATPase subunit E